MVLTDQRLSHMHGVAEYMYKHAQDYGLDPDEMYVLGLLHDIGYIRNPEDPAEAGAEILGESGYRNAYTILCQNKKLTDDDADNLKLQLLIEADLKTDVNGKETDYSKKLESIAELYGKDSSQYNISSSNIEYLKDLV